MGHIYQRGSIYWIKYYRHGRPYQESTHTDQEAEAEKLLKIREGEIASGKNPGILFERVRFYKLVEDYLTYYRINKRRSIDKAMIYANHLREFFGDVKAITITTDRINEFISARLNEGYMNSSINRELSALSLCFTLAERAGKIQKSPYIQKLAEENVRQGFFEYPEFLTIRDALPNHLKPVATFGYFTGWRKGEILNLTWNKISMRERVIILEPGQSKNKKGRKIYLMGELLAMIQELHSERRPNCPYVFNKDGARIKPFDKLWKKACKDAGLSDKLFHDFRRTCVRNLVRSGVPETVAMKITGHKTRSVFDRYNITSDEDLAQAASKQEEYIQSQAQERKVIPFEKGYKKVTISR